MQDEAHSYDAGSRDEVERFVADEAHAVIHATGGAHPLGAVQRDGLDAGDTGPSQALLHEGAADAGAAVLWWHSEAQDASPARRSG